MNGKRKAEKKDEKENASEFAYFARMPAKRYVLYVDAFIMRRWKLSM